MFEMGDQHMIIINDLDSMSGISNDTLTYYEKNATSFADITKSVDFTSVQERFLKHIPVGGRFLDFGCGAGRDTKYFLEKGYKVDAVDGSEKLCRIASEYAGIKVERMLFLELDADNIYDGIWACSSILHLPKKELKDVFEKMIRATKDSGYIYTSFKYGEFEGARNERYFTDFTERSFDAFLSEISGVQIIDEWVTADVRPGRGDEKWLNIILQKK